MFTGLLVHLCRELEAVENLLTTMSSVVKRRKNQLKLRNLYCEERVWKSLINYSIAKAHMALFYQGLDQLHGSTLQQRFTQNIAATTLFCVFLVIPHQLRWLHELAQVVPTMMCQQRHTVAHCC